jgi:hypothetical protein
MYVEGRSHRLGRRKPRGPIIRRKATSNYRINICQTNHCFDVAGIELQRAFEEAPRLRHAFKANPLHQPGPALEAQVHRIGMQRTLGSSRLSLDELGT